MLQSVGSVAAVWQQAIRALEDCCSSAVWLVPESAEAESAYDNAFRSEVQGLIGQSKSGAPPKAVWKKLVLQLKVGPAAVAGQVLIAGRPLGVGLCTSNGDWDIA